MECPFMKIENKEVFCKFIHECVNDLIGKKKAEFKVYSGEVEWSNENFQKALTLTQNLFRKSVLTKADSNNVLKIPSLSEEFQTCFEECFDIRKDEIEQFIFKNELSKCDQLFIENIDWKLKWIMGTSALSTLKKPVLQLQFHCLKRQKDINRPCINFEMDIEKVERLIAELEKAKKELGEKNS